MLSLTIVRINCLLGSDITFPVKMCPPFEKSILLPSRFFMALRFYALMFVAPFYM